MTLLLRTISNIYRKKKPMSHCWGRGIDLILTFKLFINLHMGNAGFLGPIFMMPHFPGDPYLRGSRYLSTRAIAFAVDGGPTDFSVQVSGPQCVEFLNS